jgi:hypothetical protein
MKDLIPRLLDIRPMMPGRWRFRAGMRISIPITLLPGAESGLRCWHAMAC